MNNIEHYRDLLIVERNGGLDVVDAPAHETNVGDKVTYWRGETEALGTVIDKMWVNDEDEQYRCIARVNKIYPATAIFRKNWQVDG